ncbi:hypothetical protein [Streptomyces spiramyceticus]|uniref:hypothetical protein n=1 Tax=Streptomyces spiramyceticus TaxID=299717 RepID=UPI00237C313E|nr:hypothetical protein [Streptomyces spiramyceticus]
MSKNPRTHAQRLDELQDIIRTEYGREYDPTEVSEIADWLTGFYTTLIKLAAQRRVAEREPAITNEGQPLEQL